MVPMVSMRPGPTAARNASVWAPGRSRHILRPPPPVRAIATSRSIVTNAIRYPQIGYPGIIPSAPVAPRTRLDDRKEAIKNAKPFSEFLTDSFNRQHDYLRISITERCNLRCLYCMPEEGVQLSPPAHLLTTPEIFYLSSLFVSQGVTKIRLTGGEPTVRRDIVPLMQSIGSLRSQGLRELALTTNGISLHRKLDSMVEAGLTGINLSLDTLDPFQFQIMTRRKGFDAVMKCIDRVLELKALGANLKLKINCVVMRGLNERDIVPFVELGREKDIEVRFIEYMPFDGNKWSEGKMISFQEMLEIIRTKHPGLHSIPGHRNDTSKTFQVPGFVGKVGFITSMTNDFCGTCNRLRITSDGNLKVCLHGNAEVSLRDVLRQGNGGQPIDQEAFERIKQIEMDRREGRLSDKTILGWGQREQELLNVIGAAVKRKAEKHADIGDLKNMKNRPMILIDQPAHPAECSADAVRQFRRSSSSPNTYLIRKLSPLAPQLHFLYPSISSTGSAFARTFTSTARQEYQFPRSRKNKTFRETEMGSLLITLRNARQIPEIWKWKVIGWVKTKIVELEARIALKEMHPASQTTRDWDDFTQLPEGAPLSRSDKRLIWARHQNVAKSLRNLEKKMIKRNPEVDPERVQKVYDAKVKWFEDVRKWDIVKSRSAISEFEQHLEELEELRLRESKSAQSRSTSRESNFPAERVPDDFSAGPRLRSRKFNKQWSGVSDPGDLIFDPNVDAPDSYSAEPRPRPREVKKQWGGISDPGDLVFDPDSDSAGPRLYSREPNLQRREAPDTLDSAFGHNWTSATSWQTYPERPIRRKRRKERKTKTTGSDKKGHKKRFPPPMSESAGNGIATGLPSSGVKPKRDFRRPRLFQHNNDKRKFSSIAVRKCSTDGDMAKSPASNALPHLTSSGSAHMVSVSAKPNTGRTAVAAGRVYFSNPKPISLIRSNALKKGDVLSVARISGIMAAKKCPDLIPLCHPINISHVGVALRLFDSSSVSQEQLENCGGVEIQAKVQCTGPTGVEMEALTSVMGAALTVVDMCKAVDKCMRIQDVRVVLKEGGRSGTWKEEQWEEMKEEDL